MQDTNKCSYGKYKIACMHTSIKKNDAFLNIIQPKIALLRRPSK